MTTAQKSAKDANLSLEPRKESAKSQSLLRKETQSMTVSVAPALAVAALFASTSAEAVGFAWDPIPDTRVAGYSVNITSGSSSTNINVGMNTFCTISNLTPSKTYSLGVQGYTTNGTLGDMSVRVTYTEVGILIIKPGGTPFDPQVLTTNAITPIPTPPPTPSPPPPPPVTSATVLDNFINKLYQTYDFTQTNSQLWLVNGVIPGDPVSLVFTTPSYNWVELQASSDLSPESWQTVYSSDYFGFEFLGNPVATYRELPNQPSRFYRIVQHPEDPEVYFDMWLFYNGYYIGP